MRYDSSLFPWLLFLNVFFLGGTSMFVCVLWEHFLGRRGEARKLSPLKGLTCMQVFRVLEIFLCDEIQNGKESKVWKTLLQAICHCRCFLSILRAPHLLIVVLYVLIVVQLAMSFSTTDTAWVKYWRDNDHICRAEVMFQYNWKQKCTQGGGGI